MTEVLRTQRRDGAVPAYPDVQWVCSTGIAQYAGIWYRMGDGLWVRVVDLPAALSGRSYGEGGPLVLEVRDAICDWNDGRWQLDGGACERTDAEPDLALDVSALGSAYLGAISFTQLRDAGRVQELREGTIRRADALFAWRPLPWCLEIF